MSWADLEDKVVEALQTLQRPAGPFLTVRSYGGEADSDEAVAEALGLFPACLVFVKGGRIRSVSVGKQRWQEDLAVVVMVACRTSQGERATRRGTASDVGLYAMMDLVLATLTDLDWAELPYSKLAPETHRIAKRDREATIYALEFATRRILDVATLRPAALETLERLGLAYDVDQDGQPEAEDLMGEPLPEEPEEEPEP
jgi:phage gp37-like protein